MLRTLSIIVVTVLFLASCTGGYGGRDAISSTVTDLQTYTGEFTRRDGTPVYIVSVNDGLAVVVTGNVFKLEPLGEKDRFGLEGIAERIGFGRDSNGQIINVTDSQGTYPRKSAAVPAAIEAMFTDKKVESYAYSPPKITADLEVAEASTKGFRVDSLESIVDDLNQDADYAHFHSLLISRGEKLILEEYFMGYTADRPHNLRSATKGIISALVGAAVHRGEVTLQDYPLRRIGEKTDIEISRHKASLTLGEMIDMRHGLQCDDWDEASPGNESNIYGKQDWTRFILAIPDAPGSDDGPTYCSAIPLMVGRYLEIATGKSLPAYADEVLLAPLSIKRSDWTWSFELKAKRELHGAQIYLRPKDMLRVAHLYQRSNNGDDRQIFSKDWVPNTFKAITPLGDWRRYNDFWWAYELERPGEETVTVNMASGIGGQKIAVVPKLDVAIVMTGGSFSEGRPGPTRVIERIIRSIKD